MKSLLSLTLLLLCFSTQWLKAETTNSSALDLLPETLYNAQGQSVSKTSLKGKWVGLYFSAQWCPPCRTFTPKLIDFRNRFAEEFEVVLISFDQTPQAQSKYMSKYTMPWLVTEHQSEEVEQLRRYFRISGIPTLIILSPEGQIISTRGRSEVARSPGNALELWKKLGKADRG